jgi:hypothetical protein
MEFLIIVIPALGIAMAIRAARGTTLVAPLAWALLAYLLIGIASIEWIPLTKTEWSKWMFIAATSTLCPSMALLGAKRPQNRAWQLIVFAFWFVMALPAIRSLLFQAGEGLEIHTIWKWFIAVVILAGCVNHLPTRFGWAAVVIAGGQIQLFWNHLPWNLGSPVMIGRIAGFGMILSGIVFAYLLHRIKQRQLAAYRGWNRAWRDFRDFFGVVWGLRIIERVSQMPSALENCIQLSWDGFHELTPAIGHDSCSPANPEQALPAEITTPIHDAARLRPATPDVMKPLDAGLRNLMWRFVSEAWLQSRLQNEPNGQK